MDITFLIVMCVPSPSCPAGALGYADLGIKPMKVTDGMPIEAVRYQRVGGYSYGDTKTLAKSLPANVKRYWGMGNN